MELDWAELEQLVKPSPDYADILRRLLDVVDYDFARKHYNKHGMELDSGVVIAGILPKIVNPRIAKVK